MMIAYTIMTDEYLTSFSNIPDALFSPHSFMRTMFSLCFDVRVLSYEDYREAEEGAAAGV